MARRRGMTPEELEEQKIHIEATRLRRLTDEQLVAVVHESRERRKVQTPDSERPQKSAQPKRAGTSRGVKELLQALEEGRCFGVKGGVSYKIRKMAEEMGLV